MDLDWIERMLREFVDDIDVYRNQHHPTSDRPAPTEGDLVERLEVMQQVARAVLPEANFQLAQRGYTFTFDQVQDVCRRALGLVRLREELEQRLGPAGPNMSAAALHPWVWSAAGSLWSTGHLRAAVQAAATSIDIHLQARIDRRDLTGTVLMREAFAEAAPAPGKPRLRLPGDRTSPSWRSRQAGARDFAAGCFEAVRNPATHHLEEPPEQEALEALGALSLLARWIEGAHIERHD